MSRYDKLLKMYSSEAQRRFFNSPAGKKKVGAATVKEFNEASKGAHLPEHAAKALTSSEHEKGVHQRASADIVAGPKAHNENMSIAGVLTRWGTPKSRMHARSIHQDTLNQLKSMIKPNLPKSDMEKAAPVYKMEKHDTMSKLAQMLGKTDLQKKYMGFEAVKEAAAKHGAKDPAAVAASIGRKKYGKEAFQHAAAAGKKMGKAENPDKEADAKLGEDVEHLVEDHMIENSAAEKKEGHKMVKAAPMQPKMQPAAQPKPSAPKMTAPKPPMAKNDPVTHLPGTLMDKSEHGSKFKTSLKKWAMKKGY